MGENHAKGKAKVVGHNFGVRMRVVRRSVVCCGPTILPGRLKRSYQRVDPQATVLLLQLPPSRKETLDRD
jgi:hypothetical protein